MGKETRRQGVRTSCNAARKLPKKREIPSKRADLQGAYRRKNRFSRRVRTTLTTMLVTIGK
jgi:hypothetical protein